MALRCALLFAWSLLYLPAVAAAANWGPWESRIGGGGEVSATSFGIFDVGLRKGPLSIQLFTDTIDIHLAPALARGRWWIGARVETFAAGLMISPWTAGAPDPSRALIAAYAGGDGGWMRYLPESFYVGVQGSARIYLFWALPQTMQPAPGATALFTLEAMLGHYTQSGHLTVRAGADAELHVISPHVIVEAVVRPDAGLAPRIEVRAAWARNQDFLTRTRLGGLNPYVVPLAGAGWAEFWVESYVALRMGPSARWQLPGRASGPKSLEVAIVSDLAGFDGGSAAGFGILGNFRYGRLSIDGSFGYAPWIKRQEGVARIAGFLLVGADWGPIRKKRR